MSPQRHFVKSVIFLVCLILPVLLGAQPHSFMSAGLLGAGSSGMSITGTAILSDGRIAFAANLGTQQPTTGATEWLHLNGGSLGAGAGTGQSGAVVIVSADGMSIERVSWLGDSVWDLALDGQDRIHVAAGEGGLITLNADADTLVAQRLTEFAELGDLSGKVGIAIGDFERLFVERVDATEAGDVVALLPTKVGNQEGADNLGQVLMVVYGADGMQRASFAGNSQHTNDVAISSEHNRVVFLGYRVTSAVVNSNWQGSPQWSFPVHIPYMAARDLDGNLLWIGYNWETHPWTDSDQTLPNDQFLNFPFFPPAYDGNIWDWHANNMADTRGYRICFGRDGYLYAAYESAGGNTPLRWNPYDLRDSVELIGGDPWFNFNQTASEHKTVFLRYQPATGEPLIGQYFTTRYQNPTTGALVGNSAFMRRGGMAADEDGRLYIGGLSASGLPFWPSPGYRPSPGEITFNPSDADAYTGGGWFLVVSPDFRSREYLTRLSSESHTLAVDARKVGGTIPQVVWSGRQPLLDGNGKPAKFYETNPLVAADATASEAGFYAILGSEGEPLDTRTTVCDLRFTPDTLLGNSNLRNSSLTNTATDFNSDSVTDTVGRYPFSLTDPLTQNGANYRGLPIYGGVELVTLDQSDHAAALRVDTTFNAIFATGMGGLKQRLAALFVVKKDDFAFMDGGNFLLGPGSLFWLECAQFGRDLEAHWAVRDGTNNWLISEATWDPDLGWHELASTDRWAAYDPETTLWWDAGTAVFSEQTLADVQVLGVWIGGGDLTGSASLGLRFNQFTVQADRRTSTGLSELASGIALTSANASPEKGTYLVADPITFTLQEPLPEGSSVTWSFGDGATSAVDAPTYAFPAAGTYLVSGTIQDGSGGNRVYQKWITIQNSVAHTPAPKAVISSDALIGEIPLCIDFHGTSSTGSSLTYTWDFGNGESAASASASSCYDEADTYAVTLTVTDSVGRTDTAHAYVKAVFPPPAHPRLVLGEEHLSTVRAKVAQEGTIQRKIYGQMLEAAKPEIEGGESWYVSFNIISQEAGTPALLPGETTADLPDLYRDGQPNPALVAAAAAVADDPATREYLKNKALELVFFLIKPRSNGTGPQADLYYKPGIPESQKWQAGDDPLGIYDPIHGQINPLTGRPYLGKSDVSLERYGVRYERQWAVTNSALFRGTEMKAVAMAYDFCYDLWLADDIANGTNNVEIISRAIVQQADSLMQNGGSGWPGNDAYGSNWFAIRYSMAALGYLVADTEYDPANLDFVDSRFRLYAQANMGSAPTSMGWNLEGYGYAGFSMPFAHAYMIAHKRNGTGNDYYTDFPGMRLQPFSMFQGVLPIPNFQSHDMSSVYPHNLKLGVRPDFSDDGQFTWETSGLEGLVFHPDITPPEIIPGIRWLYDHLCGELGDETYGHGYTRSFYSLFFYPDEIAAVNPRENWGLHFFDPAFGIFLMRDAFTPDNGLKGTPYNTDIVFGTTANKRVAQGGHSAPDQHGLRLWGLGLPWLVGGGRTGDAAGQSTLFAFEPEVSTHRFNPGTVEDYYLRPGGGGYTITSSGLLSSVGTEFHTRRTVVSFDEARTGASAVLVVADTSNNGTYWRLNTPGNNRIELTGDRTFTITLDAAEVSANPNVPADLVANPPKLYGQILEPMAGVLSTGSVARPAQFENARIYGQDFPTNHWVQWEATGGDTQFVVALSLVPGGVGAPSVSWIPGGQGIDGVVTVGSQSFDFRGEQPVVSGWERPSIAFAPAQPDYFLSGQTLDVSGSVEAVSGRTIDRVEVELDGVLAGTAALGVSALTWELSIPDLPVGIYALRAVAYDDGGEWSQTEERFIAITNSIPPEIHMLTPGQYSTFVLGEEISLTGKAVDPDGQIDAVDIRIDGNLQGQAAVSSTSGAWSFTLAPIKADTYTVEAVARDDSGDRMATDPLTLAVSSRFNEADDYGDLADFYHDAEFVEVVEHGGEPVIRVKPNTGSGYRSGLGLKGGDVVGDVRLRFMAKAEYGRTLYPLEWYEVAIGGSVWYRMSPSFGIDEGTNLMLENSGDGMVWRFAREPGIPDDGWHHIEVERVNDNMRLFLDGRVISNFAEPRLANPGMARITLPWRNRNISMLFKDIELVYLDREETVPPGLEQKTLIGHESLVSGTQVELSGTFSEGSWPVQDIHIYVGSRVVANAQLELAMGTWTATWIPEIVGRQEVSVEITDTRGNTSWTKPVAVMVAESVQSAQVEPPVVTVFEPTGPIQLSPGESFVMSGRAAGGSHALSGLWMDFGSGTEEEIPVDEEGYWQVPLDTETSGSWQLQLTGRSASGLETTVSGIQLQIAAPSPDLPIRINFAPEADQLNGWRTFDGDGLLALYRGVSGKFSAPISFAADNDPAVKDPSDSFLRMGGTELALRVPNGLYTLTIAVGDPTSTTGGASQRLSVQGATVVNETTSSDDRLFVHKEAGVLVTDSILRLEDISLQTGLCWLILERADAVESVPEVVWESPLPEIPKVWGTGLSLPLTVSTAPGASGTAVGTVQFIVNGELFESVSVVDDAAATTWTPQVSGTYSIDAWAVDSDGNGWGAPVRHLTVQDGFRPPPVIAVTASVASGELPLTVNFDASGTYCPAGSELRFDWNFGNGLVNRFPDGSPWYDHFGNPVSGVDAVHPEMTYHSAGSHRVLLMVSNPHGITSLEEIRIEVMGREVVINDASYDQLRFKGRWDYWYTQSRSEGPYLWEAKSDNYKKNTFKGTKEAWVIPHLPGAGRYRLYEWSPYTGSPDVELTVNHVGSPSEGTRPQTSLVSYSQQDSSFAWQDLGTFHFDPNQEPGLWLPNEGTSGYLYLDGYRWVAEGPLASVAWSFVGEPANARVLFDAADSQAGASGSTLSCSWDFGNGATGSGTSIEHTFPGAGTYAVLLTVNDGHETAATRFEVAVPTAPDDVFHLIAPSRISSGTLVSMEVDMSALQPVPADPVWDFGDGNDSTGNKVSHSWQFPGLYEISVELPDGAGGVLAQSTKRIEVTSTIANTAPAASITIDSASGYAPLVVEVSPDGSADLDGAIVLTSWDFGDGITATNPRLSHTYTSPGVYPITLEVTDDDGATGTATRNVVVSEFGANRAPVAVLSAEPASGVVPLTVSFSALASYDPDGDAVNFSWNGSGTGGTEASFTHTFTEVGIHVVELSVKDGSLTDIVTANIVVQPEISLPVIDIWILEEEAIRETGQAAVVEFVRQADDISESLTVSYRLGTASTAVEGTDFTFSTTGGELSFAPYETQKTLTVSPVSGTAPTGPLSVIVELVDEDFYMAGARASGELVLRDTDFSVTAGADQVVAADSQGGTGSVSLSGSSEDAALVDQWIWSIKQTGDVLAIGQSVTVDLPVGGPYRIELSGESTYLMETVTDIVHVSVVDFGQLPPVAAVANPGSPMAVDGRFAEVVLDGSPSYDPDGSIVAWTWFLDGSAVATGEHTLASLHVGTHELILRVEDTDGNIDETVFSIEVRDSTYEVYLIDFGLNESGNPVWNQVNQFHTGGIFDNQPRTDDIPLTSTYGTQSAFLGDIAFHSSRLFMSTGTEYITPPVSDWIETDVGTDSLMIYDENGTAFLDFAIWGLDGNNRYDVELFCSRYDANWETISVWVNSLAATGEHSSLDFQMRFNTNKSLLWQNLTPLNGRLRIQMNGPTNNSKRLPVVAMRVVEQKVYPEERYRVSLSANIPEAVELSGGGRVFVGDKIVIEAMLTNRDYHFVQWSDGNTDLQRTIPVHSDLSLFATVEPVSTPSGYDLWKELHWPGLNNPGITGPLVDADLDGILNILEYAFGSSPVDPSSRGELIIETSPADVIQVRFTQIADTLLDYTLQHRSLDPDQPWQPIWSSTGSGNVASERILQPSVPSARTQLYRMSITYEE